MIGFLLCYAGGSIAAAGVKLGSSALISGGVAIGVAGIFTIWRARA